MNENKNVKKSSNKILAVLVLFAGIILISIGCVLKLMDDENTSNSKNNKATIEKQSFKSEYRLNGNGLENFDLAFLKLENNNKNMIYSPLSIKFALEMLSDGASGNTKTELDNIIGDYKYNKYNNDSNKSFANAFFIRDTYKSNILDDYISKLKNKYNAEVIIDSFKDSSTINKWVSDKTFNLIDKIYDNNQIKQLNFSLVNALAINMNWTNQIQCESNKSDIGCKYYSVDYLHEKYSDGVGYIERPSDYTSLDFSNNKKVKSVKIGASINKYDIVNTLGRDNIYKEIKEEYTKWLVDNPDEAKYALKDTDKFTNQFIEELNSNYKKIDDSTDFYFLDNSDVLVFAKDLKEYDGLNLQYVGIMPKNGNLSEYIKNVDKEKLNEIITNLKDISLDNFEEGYVTKIKGVIPMFKFDYELDLNKDLKSLGVNDVFSENVDLSKMLNKKDVSITTSHKANIEFSNDGIKASAVAAIGGLGDSRGGFEHLYEVPVKEIDLTFDKPYLFLIRDKKSNEVWFIGNVYEPTLK